MALPNQQTPQVTHLALTGKSLGSNFLAELNSAFTVEKVRPNIIGGASKIRVPLLSCSRNGDGGLVVSCRSGLGPAVRGYLRLQGLPFHETPGVPLQPLDQRGSYPRNPQLLDFARNVARGRIVVRRSDCPFAGVVADIVNGFPDHKFVLIVEVNPKGFCQEIRGHTRRKVGLSTQVNPEGETADVVVATGKSLGGTNSREADYVIFIDPCMTDKDDPMFVEYSCPKDVARYCPKLARLADVQGRLLAVLDADTKYSPLEAARLAQVFGPDSVRVLCGNTDPKETRYPREARILWAKLKSPAGIGNIGDPFELKRAGVWANPILARHVARLAKALKAGGMDVCNRLFPHLPKEWVEGQALRVVVYVESLDHAELLGKLSGLPILTGKSVPLVNFSGAIVTEMGAGFVNGNDVDVVIRADLGFGVPNCLLADWMASLTPAPRPLYILDFHVNGGALLRKSLASRRNAYLDAHCRDVGVHPDDHAYRMFCRQITQRWHR